MEQNRKKNGWYGLAAAVAVALVLTACGGGGSGGGATGGGSTGGTGGGTTTTSGPPPAPTGSVVNTVPTSGREVAPQVVFNSAGVGLAVWESADGPIYETNHIGRAIWYSLYQGGKWSPEAILQVMPDTDSNSGNTGGYFQAQVAASATGFAVVWLLQQDRTYPTGPSPSSYFMSDLYARVFDGANWSGVTKLVAGTTPVSAPAIASNGSGYMVTWEQTYVDPLLGTATNNINAKTYGGGAWSGVTQVYSTANPLGSNTVASNGSGYAMAWTEFNGSVFVSDARIFSGGVWGTTKSFTGLTGFAGSPYLASSGGNYMLAWDQGFGTDYSVGSGTSWSTPTAAPMTGGLAGLVASGSGYAAVYGCADPASPSDTSMCGVVYGAGAWGSQMLLENVSGSNSANPVLASDGTGYGVLWRQFNSTTSDYNVYYNTFTATAAGTPILVSATKGASDGPGATTLPTASPREAIGYDGAGYMLGWIQVAPAGTSTATTSTEQVYAQQYSGTSAGTMNALLTAPHDSGVDDITLTTNNAGIKLATWQQYYFDMSSGVPSYEYGQFAAATDASGVWGQPVLLDTYGSAGYPAKVISNGTSFAIAYQSVSQLVVRTYNDANNGTFSAPTNESIGTSYDPALATNGTGYLVSWWETGTYPLYASIYNGASWSAPTNLIGAFQNGTPVVASNGSGYAVAWSAPNSAGTALHAIVNVYNGTTATWSGAQQVDTQTTSVNSGPAITSNGSGYLLGWQQNSGTYDSIYTSVYSGSAWGTPSVIDNKSANAYGPAMGSNGTTIMAAWQQGSNCYAREWSGTTWGTTANLGACAGSVTNVATDGTGYAVAIGYPASATASVSAAVYANNAWSPITGVMGANCTSPGYNGIFRGGPTGYGVVSLCNGGTYSNYDLYGTFFHNGAWSTPALMENGAYSVGWGIDLASDGTNGFDAAWTQPHESQTDPSVRKYYLRAGL